MHCNTIWSHQNVLTNPQVTWLMRGIKIPQQDFALKKEGGVFVGHYGNRFFTCTKKLGYENESRIYHAKKLSETLGVNSDCFNFHCLLL